MNFQVFDN